MSFKCSFWPFLGFYVCTFFYCLRKASPPIEELTCIFRQIQCTCMVPTYPWPRLLTLMKSLSSKWSSQICEFAFGTNPVLAAMILRHVSLNHAKKCVIMSTIQSISTITFPWWKPCRRIFLSYTNYSHTPGYSIAYTPLRHRIIIHCIWNFIWHQTNQFTTDRHKVNW